MTVLVIAGKHTKKGASVSNKKYFSFMKFAFKIRDMLYSRAKVLAEVGIKSGDTILDYGCGTGSYEPDASKLTGETGVVYALDRSQVAIDVVKDVAEKNILKNIKVINSDKSTGLAAQSVDVILFYDILHHLENYGEIIVELHRVLKNGGILSCSDHHMKEEEIRKRLESTGLFLFKSKGRKTLSFAKKV